MTRAHNFVRYQYYIFLRVMIISYLLFLNYFYIFSQMWFFIELIICFHYKELDKICLTVILCACDEGSWVVCFSVFGDYSCFAPVSLQGGNCSDFQGSTITSDLLFSQQRPAFIVKIMCSLSFCPNKFWQKYATG